MSILIGKILENYDYVVNELSDPRTRNHTILTNPIIMIGVCYLYYKVIRDWGPSFMKTREPYQLKNVLIVYNLFQIIASAAIFIGSVHTVWWSGYYSIVCQPLSRETTPIEMKILEYVKIYYYIKLIDLLDTIFFIFRKKNNQATFLHVYHHIGMVLVGFMTLKYVPAGHGTMLGTINSLVHTFMYSYYFLTILYPEYKKNLWWKKYITQLQLAQFGLLTIHFSHVLFQPNCTYPKWISLVFLPQNIFMMYLFGDFYYKAYIKKKQ